MKRYELLAVTWLMVFSCGCAAQGCTKKGEAAMKEEIGPAIVDFDVKSTDLSIEIAYSVTNVGSSPIFVLDHLASLESPTDEEHAFASVDPNWGDIELLPDGFWSFKAVISRSDAYRGVCSLGEPVRLARRLEPGEKASGTFERPLPLKEDTSKRIDHRRHRRVDIRSVAVAIAWLPAPPPDSYVPRAAKIDGETFWWFGYDWNVANQQLAVSSARPVSWQGESYGP